MLHIGSHNELMVYEPINTWLRSPEDGLRYHRSMDVEDVCAGPLEMATFGKAVVGAVGGDSKWLVNPIGYDPSRPPPVDDEQKGESLRSSTRATSSSVSTPVGEP